MEIKNSHPTPKAASATKDEMHTADLSTVETCSSGQQLGPIERIGTKRDIKSRHAQMIAIGGTIGTGLFVGSGQALATGGPGFLLIAYCIVSLMVYGVITAVIEVCAFLPVSGCSMAYYCNRYVSSSMGFALGWLYFYSFGILVAYEITAASIVIGFWPNNVNLAVWITIILIVIVGLNFCAVGIYAETEFWFAGLKVIMIMGLLILAFILAVGGGPTHDRLGFRYWNEPGAFKPYIVGGSGGYFTAFLYTWIFSAFSFYFGPELIVFTAGEMRNPRKNLPIAGRRFFYRLVIFYALGALAIGIICRSDSEGLTSATGNANASPWVIAIRNAQISTLPTVINAGILISAWSAGNAFLYMSSRALYSLACAGQAPAIFARCNKFGLPIYAVMASSCFAFLAYLNVASQAGQVFNWFISLTNTAGFTSWLVCCLVHLRFRNACDVQGVSVPYQSRFQPYASWTCIFLFGFLLLANGFTVFYPGRFTASGFLTSYIGIPVFIIIWMGHKLTAGKNDKWILKPESIDLVMGVHEIEADAEAWRLIEAEQKHDQSKARHPLFKKLSILWG